MQLTIEKLVYGGDGLARLPADNRGHGKAAFIPFVLAGEKIEASLTEQKSGFARAVADQLLESSGNRVEPRCPYFKRCGGCHYQHSNYSHQLEIKAAILRENLRRIAKLELDIELQIHPSPPWNYRNRSRFAVQSSPQFALCYRKFNSNQLFPVDECSISSPLINRAISAVSNLGRSSTVPMRIHEIEFFTGIDDQTVLIDIYCADNMSASEAETWSGTIRRELSEVTGVVAFKTSSTYSQTQEQFSSVGEGEITCRTSQASYRVSAGSFFQVNRNLINQLVSIVTGGISGNTALDLYAGVGLFSSVLNREFQRVIAVEASPTSYADLLYNSAPNVKAVHATTENYLTNVAGSLRPDLIVVDPPRNGLSDSIINTLASLKAPCITYVSCDPATLSRDLRNFLRSGYKVGKAHLIDLFPQTFHIESVFQLIR